MDDRVRALEQRIRTDPADARSIRALVALYDRIDRRFQGRNIGGWVELLDDPWLQKHALEVLASLGPLALPAVPRAADIHRADGLHAFEALELIDAAGPAAAKELVSAYLTEDLEPRSAILDRLGSFGAAARPILADLEALRRRCSAEQRLYLERAIWRIAGDPQAILLLAEAILLEKNEELYGPLIRLLKELGEDARPVLTWLLAASLAPGPYATDLAEAVIAIDDRDPRLIDQYARLLEHPEIEHARQAAGILARLGPAARPILVEALEDAASDLRGALLDALACVGLDEASAAVVREHLSAADPGLRVAAAEALGPEHGGSEAHKLLIGALTFDHRQATRAARALSAFETDAHSAIDPLIHSACSTHAPLRRASLNSLIAIAADPHSVCRRFLSVAIRARNYVPSNARLSSIRNAAEAWVTALEHILQDKDPQLRFAAAVELEALGATAAPGFKAAVLENIPQAGAAGTAALEMVGRLGASIPEASPALIKILEDEPASWRGEDAANVLAAIGPAAASALPALDRLINSDHPAAEAAAFASLKIKGPNPRAVQALVDAADDLDLWTQIEACRFLARAGADAADALDILHELHRRSAESRDVRDEAARAIRHITAALDRQRLERG